MNPHLKLKLVGTEEWARYVNEEHFVPVEFEGLPPGHKFDFNWVPMHERAKKPPLPWAEVSEQGTFTLWKELCNFFEFDLETCRETIRSAVAHEARHYLQWQSLAIEALESIRPSSMKAFIPYQLSDLKPVPGAVERFLEKWSNGPHYQCREVEVYSTQILNGEVPAYAVPGSLKMLLIYYRGCSESRWSNDFEPYLINARALFRANDIQF